MRGFRVKGLGFSLLIVTGLFLSSLSPIPYTLNPALAADSSPSADDQSKIKSLLEEIASKAASIKNDVSKKLQNKAYTGTIKSKDGNSLTINLRSGVGNVVVNEFTEYIIKSKSLIGNAGLKNLAATDTVAALGDVDDNGVLTAKRIVKITSPLNPIKKIIHGTLTSIATSSAELKTGQNDQFSIAFDKNTDYQLGKTDGNFSDIKANKWIVAVTEEIKPESPLLAKFVYIFP